MRKKRLDILLVDRGLAESRNWAQRLIMAGEVLVNGQLAHKPSETVAEKDQIELKSRPKYVSRGGYKLEAALKAFGLTDLSGKICVDIGASTGGFTDCMFQFGAEKVYAIDVGYGQLHYSLRDHPNVVLMERVNIREVENLPEEVDFIVIDLSFISLKLVFPVILAWPRNKTVDLIALVKPQFEAGREEAAKGKGVIKDEEIRENVLEDTIEFAEGLGFTFIDSVDSPITGRKGNVEILARFQLKKFQNS